MKRGLLFFLLCFSLQAAENSIELDPARTSITFTLGDVLHTVHGTFQLKRGALTFDSTSGRASGEIVVDVASGKSGDGARDRRMHKEILESARYPDAVFTAEHVSGELAPGGASDLDLQGTFKIHGAGHPMTLHFHAEHNGGDVIASTSFVIPYVQWGMKNPSNFLLKVNDTVELNVRAFSRLQ